MTTEQELIRADLPALECSVHDDPRVVADAVTEDYSLHVMPHTWRLGKFRLLMAWSSIVSAFFWMIVGAQISFTVGTRDAVIGIGLAVLAYGVINYVFSAVGSRNGITVALLSRGLFGYYGAAVATLVFAAGAIYFATFEASVLAVAFSAEFGGPLKLWYLVVILYQIPLVIGGVRRWLDRLNTALLPFYFAGIAAAIIWAIAKYSYSSTWLHLPALVKSGIMGPGWMFAFATYMGVWLAMFYAVDFGRFGRVKDERFTGIVTFGPVFWSVCLLANALVGTLLASLLPADPGGLTTQVVSLMGIFGLLLVFVSQTKVNSANLYMASTNLESFCERGLGLRLPRWVWVLTTGVIVYLFMLTNVFTFLIQALNYQAVVVVAWVGIALVELTVRRVKNLPALEYRPGRVAVVNAPGLVAWVASSALGIILLATNATFANTWGAAITFGVSMVLYLALRVSFGNQNDKIVRANDPRDEVGDAWETRVRCHKCTKSYIAIEMDRDPSAGNNAICASCATGGDFLRSSRNEMAVQ